jgi:hypothetical protein
LSLTACREAGTDCADADAAITAVAAMNASFESLFIFLLSKLRLPQVYCEPVDCRHVIHCSEYNIGPEQKTRRIDFEQCLTLCVGILPYRSLPTIKKSLPYIPPRSNVVHAQQKPHGASCGRLMEQETGLPDVANAGANAPQMRREEPPACIPLIGIRRPAGADARHGRIA